MRSLLSVNPSTVKVSFKVETAGCCGQTILEKDRFSVDVVKQGCDTSSVCDIISNGKRDCIASYKVFDITPEGYMTIVLDSAIKELCPGRYIFRVLLDDCTTVHDIKFVWGESPVLVDVNCEDSKQGDCFDEMGMSEDNISILPDLCCDPCPTETLDPCQRFVPECCD